MSSLRHFSSTICIFPRSEVYSILVSSVGVECLGVLALGQASLNGGKLIPSLMNKFSHFLTCQKRTIVGIYEIMESQTSH